MTAAPRDSLNVIGCVVQTAPGRTASVREALGLLPGVDIHAEAEDGRLVITVLDTGAGLAIDQLAAMNRMPGVVSTMLAYHEIDDAGAAGDAPPLNCSAERA
jgi:nitrate reductase NapD